MAIVDCSRTLITSSVTDDDGGAPSAGFAVMQAPRRCVACVCLTLPTAQPGLPRGSPDCPPRARRFTGLALRDGDERSVFRPAMSSYGVPVTQPDPGGPAEGSFPSGHHPAPAPHGSGEQEGEP